MKMPHITGFGNIYVYIHNRGYLLENSLTRHREKGKCERCSVHSFGLVSSLLVCFLGVWLDVLM